MEIECYYKSCSVPFEKTLKFSESSSNFFKKVLKGLSISDIRLNKFRLRREEFSRPCGEVINDGYFMAERQKLVDQMRTYKSGTAGY